MSDSVEITNQTPALLLPVGRGPERLEKDGEVLKRTIHFLSSALRVFHHLTASSGDIIPPKEGYFGGLMGPFHF